VTQLDPQRTALLLMDFQPGIVGRLDDPDALLARAAEAISRMREAGGHVGYVRVAFEHADFDAMPETSGMAARVSSMREAMSGVLLSTVRDASDRDYRVIVLADASADPEPDVHAFLTERIFPRQAEVITVAELEERLPAR
jgi:nicotinamidase-related amidase